jgi:hypothetical protein
MVAVALAAVLAAPGLQAQAPFRLASGFGEAGFRFDGERTAFRPGSGSSGAELREWIQIPLSGVLFGPGTISYDVAFRPTFQQRYQSNLDNPLRARYLDANGRVGLMPGRALSLQLSGARATGSSSGGFGGRQEFHRTQVVGSLGWRNPYLPAQLTASRRTSDDHWQNGFGGSAIQLAAVERSLGLSLSNSKTQIDVQRLEYRDRVNPFRYDTWNGAGVHTLRWGKGSRLISSYDLAEQSGAFETSRRAWGEQLHLQHTRAIATEYYYRQNRTAVGAVAGKSEAYGGRVSTRPARWAALSFEASRAVGRSDGTRRQVTALSPGVGVAIPIGVGISLAGSGLANFESRDSRGAPDVPIAVPDEPHIIPVGRSFTLDQAPVDTVSIVVRSATGAQVYQQDLDYVLVPIGPAVRIDVPPTSRIAVGDQVRVSYVYFAPASQGRSIAFEYDVGLRWRFGDLSHRRSRRNASRGADPGGLADFDDQRTSLRLFGRAARGQVSLDASRRDIDRARQRQHDTQIAGSWARSFDLLSLNFGAGWSRARLGPTSAEALNGSIGVGWNASAALRLQGRFEAFQWDQTGVGIQRYLSATLELGWRVGRLQTDVRYEHHHRDYVALQVIDRLSVQMLRRF